MKRRIDLAEKKPRTELPRHQVGVFALPPQSRLCAQWLLQDRGCIDKYLHVAVEGFAHPAANSFKAFLQDIVIVLISGIDGDITTTSFSEVFQAFVR